MCITAEVLLSSGFLSVCKSLPPHFSESLFNGEIPTTFIRTDTALFTVMGILLLAGFEDIFVAGRLYDQIRCVLVARSCWAVRNHTFALVWESVHLPWKPVSSEISCLLGEVVKTCFTILGSRIFFAFELFRVTSLKSPVGSSLKFFPCPVYVDS